VGAVALVEESTPLYKRIAGLEESISKARFKSLAGMEWKSPTITKLVGAAGEEELLLLYLELTGDFIEIHANTAAVGWGRVLFHWEVPYKTSTSTLLEGDVRFFCLEH
jgi:hypothetical protein